jgi:hypothetical protein
MELVNTQNVSSYAKVCMYVYVYVSASASVSVCT